MTRFDSRFGKEKFDFYQSSLSCFTFNYYVDGNFGSVVFGSMMHNLFPIANEGFVIIGSQYSGTFTKNPSVHDEFGGNDVTALLNYIPSIEGADEKRIGMFGASRGGMHTHLAVKNAKNIKAITSIAGNSDLLKGLTYRPEMEKYLSIAFLIMRKTK